MNKTCRTAIALCAVTGIELSLAAAPASANPAPVASPPADGQAASKGGFFDSLKQAFTQDLNREVVRGHFDVGTAPDSHRFYCLVDPRTGKNEEYAVGGDPFVRPDGMTGIKSGAVTPNSCSTAEEQGRLITDGYTVKLSAKAAARPSAVVPAAPVSPAPTPPPAPVNAAAPSGAAASAASSSIDRIDVAGIRLGMTPEQVRSILRVKALGNYFEGTGSLGANARFVNEIAAWSAVTEGAESYEIRFTPVPGKERVEAVIHSVRSPADGRLTFSAWQSALMRKYGGYQSSSDLPAVATWHLQGDGRLDPGDTCERRSIVGGLAPEQPSLSVDNLSLKTTAEEFRYQVERCGGAIVTADVATSDAGKSGTGSMVLQFTVTAYSPSIGLEGASAAAQIIQSGVGARGRGTGGTNGNPADSPPL